MGCAQGCPHHLGWVELGNGLLVPKTMKGDNCYHEEQRHVEDRLLEAQLLTGAGGGGQPLPPAAGQLSLPPPPLFCSEAVALVKFPASLFRTLSKV